MSKLPYSLGLYNNFLLTKCEGNTVSYGGTGTKVREITLEF